MNQERVKKKIYLDRHHKSSILIKYDLLAGRIYGTNEAILGLFGTIHFLLMMAGNSRIDTFSDS